MSFSYETAQADRTTSGSTTSLEAPDEVNTPIVDDAPGPLVPAPSGDTTASNASLEAFNTFTCDNDGDVALDFNTTPASDATSVDIVYSYSFETMEDDPNTVSLIEAAVVGTMVATLLDCPATSGGTGRALTSASSVSTTFSDVLSRGEAAASDIIASMQGHSICLSPSFSSIFLHHIQTHALRLRLGLLATLSEAPSISSLKMVQHLKRPGSKLSELSRVPWIGATMLYLPSPRFPTLALMSVMTVVIRLGFRSQPTLIRPVSLHLLINRGTAACPT